MSRKRIAQYLAGQSFFTDLPEEYLDILAERAETKDLDEDEVLFRYGAPAGRFFLIESGRMTLEVAALEGPPLELQNLGPGAVLGWSWLIPPYKWSFQARAEEPTRVLEFDGVPLLERCESDPAFGYAMLKRFATLMLERLTFARQKMIDEWSPPGMA